MKDVFWLKDLGGNYKIEKTENWDTCTGNDKSYEEIIKVKGSRESSKIGMNPITGLPHVVRYMPSHLYKFSETHLCLYMKDHKNEWPKLAEITGENHNGFDRYEEDFIFPVSKFNEVCHIIKFRERKRLSEDHKEQLRIRMREMRDRKSKFQPENPDKSIGSLNTQNVGTGQGNINLLKFLSS